MKELNVGDNCFITATGQIGSIVAFDGPSAMICVPNDCSSAIGYVQRRACMPVASEIFPVGMRVMTSFAGCKDFKGTVTAHEVATNRVVCVSDRIENYDNDRTRYSYAINELKELDESVHFEIGKHYKLNTGTIVRAVQHPDPSLVILCDEKGYLVTVLFRASRKEDLLKEGIKTVSPFYKRSK